MLSPVIQAKNELIHEVTKLFDGFVQIIIINDNDGTVPVMEDHSKEIIKNLYPLIEKDIQILNERIRKKHGLKKGLKTTFRFLMINSDISMYHISLKFKTNRIYGWDINTKLNVNASLFTDKFIQELKSNYAK